MINNFNDRLNIQREIVDIINKSLLLNEPLISLSNNAINRWSATNNISNSTDIVCLLKDISYDLSFIANRSQAPIEESDKIYEDNLIQKLDQLKLVVSRVVAIYKGDTGHSSFNKLSSIESSKR